MSKSMACRLCGEGGTRRRFGLLLGLLMVAACARSVPVEDGPDLSELPEEEGEIVVRIDNQHFQQAVIVAHLGGRRIRLGEFEGKTRRVVRIDWQDRDLYFEVRLLANERVRRTPAIRPYPDEVLDITIDSATGRVHLRR